MNEQREEILNTATQLFREKGLHFTMQDIAARMHISKKTIYKEYPGKEELLLDLTEHGFQRIHAMKKKIIDSDLDIGEKLGKVLIAMPEDYETLDFRKLEGIDKKYPRVARALRENLETNWDPTIQLLQQGIDAGVFRPVNLQVFRIVVTASIESFLSTDDLNDRDIGYHEALNEMVDIIMKGVIQK